MRPYPKYKKTNIKWIGEIPENWDVKKIKWIEHIVMGQSPSSSDYSNNSTNLPFLQGNVDFKKIYPEPRIYCNTANKRAIVNDILLSVRAPIGAINISDREYGIGRGLCAIRTHNNLHKYLYYQLLSRVKELKSLGTGSTFEAIAIDDIKNIIEIIPPIKEQKQISSYLDYNISLIDKLIGKNEKQIKLLEEKRKATINQAVTCGLDESGNLRQRPKDAKSAEASGVGWKDSGVEWIGEIPKHWEIKKLRYLGSCQNGISKGGEYFGHGFPFVNYSDVYKKQTIPSRVKGLVDSSENDRKNYSVSKGDIFFTRTSETVDEIGIASTCLKDIKDAVFAGFLIRFRPFKNILLEEFSKYFFRSDLHRVFFVKEMNLVTRASLSQELLKRLLVILPSIQEQKEISAYLDKRTREIDELRLKLKKQNILLKEYRQSLISHVVTGKVDIRSFKSH